MSDKLIIEFLDVYSKVKDDCNQTMHKNHVAVIQFDTNINSSDEVNDLINHAMIRGKLNSNIKDFYYVQIRFFLIVKIT